MLRLQFCAKIQTLAQTKLFHLIQCGEWIDPKVSPAPLSIFQTPLMRQEEEGEAAPPPQSSPSFLALHHLMILPTQRTLALHLNGHMHGFLSPVSCFRITFWLKRNTKIHQRPFLVLFDQIFLFVYFHSRLAVSLIYKSFSGRKPMDLLVPLKEAIPGKEFGLFSSNHKNQTL